MIEINKSQPCIASAARRGVRGTRQTQNFITTSIRLVTERTSHTKQMNDSTLSPHAFACEATKPAEPERNGAERKEIQRRCPIRYVVPFTVTVDVNNTRCAAAAMPPIYTIQNNKTN